MEIEFEKEREDHVYEKLCYIRGTFKSVDASLNSL